MQGVNKPGGDGVLAVDAKRLAELLGLSVRTIRALGAAGKLPAPVVIGVRSVRWIVRDIERWLQLGCPDCATWETMQQSRTR